MLAPRNYLDFEKTVKENGIREKDLIVAQRVKKYTN
ncbi:MAG: TssN family type VI secretion system protein [Bacteroides sp.]|nr:TssN family type VI secretion system protein [Bacteroides sp.]